MISRFPGTCRTCGSRFQAGAEVTWSRQDGVTSCPRCAGRSQRGAPPAPAPRKTPSPAKVPGETTVRKPSRGRDDGYHVGDVLHLLRVPGGGGPDNRWWVPFEVGKDRNEDDEWECWARVRPATDAEVAPVLSVVEKKQRRDDLLKELDRLVRDTSTHSYDAPSPFPKGKEIVLHQNMAGSDRYIVTDDVVVRVTSSYDDGPNYWVSKDRRALEIAQQLLL